VRIDALVLTSNRAAIGLLRRVLRAPKMRIEGRETVVAAAV
jgi:hypothetical protein